MSLPASPYNGNIVVVGSKTTQNINAVGIGLQFATVSIGNENLGVGASILFRMNNDTIRLNVGASNYFLIPESDIVLIENAALS